VKAKGERAGRPDQVKGERDGRRGGAARVKIDSARPPLGVASRKWAPVAAPVRARGPLRPPQFGPCLGAACGAGGRRFLPRRPWLVGGGGR